MAQIIRITSEALQATIRRLLPSQQGFGEDLQASNVIQPIIDLTPTAEGTALPREYQEAFSHGGLTFFEAGSGSTTTIANTPGFYRIIGTATVIGPSSGSEAARLELSDGLSQKKMWVLAGLASTNTMVASNFDQIVFLDTGDSLLATTTTNGAVNGGVRQVADRYGVLSNPPGFTFE